MAGACVSYSCEICGAEGLGDEEMRSHIVGCHVRDAVACPFCALAELTSAEMLRHVNTAHLDFLTPDREMISMAFIDDDEPVHHHSNHLPINHLPINHHQSNHIPGSGENLNNNNNNNVVMGAGARGELALNLKPCLGLSLNCPLCGVRCEGGSARLEEHINREHFDLTSPSLPSLPPASPHNYTCPLCVHSFENTPDLELHVNIEHKDILSPAKPMLEAGQDPVNNVCPICCMTNFKTTEDLAIHIDDHFNQKGMSPMTPDVSYDRLLAKEMEKRDREVRRLREQHEFQLLRAQYGMDNEGNFKEQSLTNMQRAVYSGELSVADYYERQIELKMAESSGIDDQSSCTKDLVGVIMSVSSNTSNVVRTYLCTTVDHYASTYGDRGWGCGYRNMQMMFSCLVHHTGYNEQLYRQWLVNRDPGELPSRSAMPSISRLQQQVEWAWSQGFDTQGSEQLGARLANTRKWIGATELVTVLSSLRIRCQLVDFHRPSCPSGSHPELFSWVLDYFQAFDDFKPPLYLQHQGHSRTIIGVEETREGGLNLLVLDPSHSPGQLAELRSTATAIQAMRLLRKTLSSMRAKHYQIVAVSGIMDSDIEYQ